MNTKYRSVMIGALLAILSSVAQAVQTIKWDKTVIPVELIVGVEQMIHFQGPATVGLPPTLANADVFRHLFASNTAYWKALAPLKTERIKVRLDNTGEFLLFDVSAKTLKRPPKTLEPLSVVVPSTTQNDPLREHPQAEEDSVTLFDLIRYAAQNDYSPPRVVQPLPGVRRVENQLRSELSRLYNHPNSVHVDMFVKQTWGVEGWYVTAITARNRTSNALVIDPSRMQHTAHRTVNGVSNQFVATAMVNRNLGPRGSKDDATMLYVVTDRPFASVIDL